MIVLVLHVCWYTYLNACTPVDIRAHYTCVQMAETGCPAGVQTARASTVSRLGDAVCFNADRCIEDKYIVCHRCSTDAQDIVCVKP